LRRTIVCLANSYKHQGRCIAGICLEDGSWIRPRGKADDGALQPWEYVLDDGSEPRLLDIIEIELHFHLPTAYHPEDWRIVPSRWRLLERPAHVARWKSVLEMSDKRNTILGGYRDRIAVTEFKDKPVTSSLSLICPSEIYWWVREDRGKRKTRALFHHNHVTYDFALTDPKWMEHLNLLPVGIYPHASFTKRTDKTWLTISLSEDFYGWHYKLVAGVIVEPTHQEPPSDSLPPWTPSPSRPRRWPRWSLRSASPRA
jgi:hypothetical protein